MLVGEDDLFDQLGKSQLTLEFTNSRLFFGKMNLTSPPKSSSLLCGRTLAIEVGKRGVGVSAVTSTYFFRGALQAFSYKSSCEEKFAV